MLRSPRVIHGRLRAFVVAGVVGFAILQAQAVRAEVHHFCTKMANAQCNVLKVRNTALFDQLAQQTRGDHAAQGAIRAVRGSAASGTLTSVQLARLADTIRATTPVESRRTLDLALAQIAVNQQVQTWLLRGVPWNTVVPTGNDVPMALVPGLARGQLIPLGFGPVLIGLGQNGDAVVLGQGNPAQVSEQVADEGAVSIEARLLNPTEDNISFTVDRQPKMLAPSTEHVLTGRGAWTVAFDRGDRFGMARYQIGAGNFKFAQTEKGWELFRATANDPAAESNDPEYVKAAHVTLPKGFKLFDPLPALSGDGPAPAKLPDHFSLFRGTAEKLTRN